MNASGVFQIYVGFFRNMKAKDWAAKFSEAATTEDREAVLAAYGQETADLIAARTKFSTSASKLGAARGVIREQRQKFAAIKQVVQALTDHHFDQIVLLSCPDLATWEAQEKKRAERPEKSEEKPFHRKKRR